MNREQADALLDGFVGRHLVVMGDAMLDRSIRGDVTRLSPEAPVPVVRVQHDSFHLGGAANVAANLAALGAKAALLAIVGDDLAGSQLSDGLRRAGIDDRMLTDGDYATTVKTRVMAHGRQIVRVDREHDGHPAAAVRNRLIDRLRLALADAEALILSDYDKGVFTPEVLRAVLASAQAAGVPVVVDPKPGNMPSYGSAAIITPNESEASQAAGIEIRGEADCRVAAGRLLETVDVGAVLITRGARGMWLEERSGAAVAIPAVAREVYDVAGAGDTVVSVVALSLASGASLPTACRLASHAAGLVVSKSGTASVNAAEIRGTLGPRGRSPRSAGPGRPAAPTRSPGPRVN